MEVPLVRVWVGVRVRGRVKARVRIRIRVRNNLITHWVKGAR